MTTQFYSEKNYKNRILVANDAYFSSVQFLAHMDTSFADSSAANRTPTLINAPTISSVQSKFGGASGLFGTSKAVTYPHSTDLNLDTGDFTIELWTYCTTAATSFKGLLVKDGSAGTRGWLFYKNDTSSVSQAVSFSFWASGATTHTVQDTSAIPINSWAHFAVVRDGNTLRLYRNGVQVATKDVTGATFNTSTNPLCLGALYSGSGVTTASSFDGYIDDIRLTNGFCRYPNGTSFTPPPLAFTNR